MLLIIAVAFVVLLTVSALKSKPLNHHARNSVPPKECLPVPSRSPAAVTDKIPRTGNEIVTPAAPDTTGALPVRRPVRSVLKFELAQPSIPTPVVTNEIPCDAKPVAPPILEPGVVYPLFDFFRDGIGDSNYPPDWDARRAFVRARDNNRCQVTGCLSLCPLDVHHKTPIHEGGSHRLDNLVSLCQVHHWLLPNHSLVAERTDEARFTMCRAHTRRYRTRPGRGPVKATFRRYQPASAADCEHIRDLYGLRCQCDSEGIHFAEIGSELISACLRCREAWSLPRLLPEELGPMLADYYVPTANKGSFHFDTSLLGAHPKRSVRLCHACANRAVIAVLQLRQGCRGPFMGCANFWSTPSCHYTESP